MKQVLIVSDNHGLTNELQEIRKRHRDVDQAIHCGDSELNIDDTFLAGYRTVRGNCDFKAKFPNETVIEIEGMTFFVTHGHLFDVKNSLLNLQYRSLEVGADIICFGHTHIAYAEKLGNQLFVNPGSIRLPKKFPEPSYILIKWTTSKEIEVVFHHVNGEEITSFPYESRFFME